MAYWKKQPNKIIPYSPQYSMVFFALNEDNSRVDFILTKSLLHVTSWKELLATNWKTINHSAKCLI